ncbi:unnamed protein product [Trifolium pratense]|uniref:Uncharacterized protein n=1 Tax=Trifolium pratense TaxID=57577 RepID=A0ACB0KBH9_TRIPR|nr:unnamed protein product [Trifolium pratense]
MKKNVSMCRVIVPFQVVTYFYVSLKYNDEAIVLQAAVDGKLFILNNIELCLWERRVTVNISCIDPNSSKDDYSYDILARSKKCSLKSQSCSKNVQRNALATNSSESLMIPFPFGYFSSSKPLTLEIRINRMINIFIKKMTGKIFSLRVKSSDTILDVKLKILDKEGYPVHVNRLIFDGKQLDDNPTLAHYTIEENLILHLVLRLCGS